MSDNIPFEIQIEIIQRVPDTKSLIRYRSVSKAWKYVIDSKKFVNTHTLRHTHHHDHAHHHLLIRLLQDYGEEHLNYLSIVDDDTFPHQKVSVFVPDSVKKFIPDSIIVGSSHGLFCLYNCYMSTAVIWNPKVRKTVATALPNVLCEPYYRTVVGFGVCPCGFDPKLVRITYVCFLSELQYVHSRTHVEVFRLSSGETWSSPLSSNVPHKSIGFGDSQAVVDGFIYWDAVDRINRDDGDRKLIMSFDLTSEEFTKVNLPDCLALNLRGNLLVSNLRESLAVIEFDSFTRKTCDVWMMIGHGCSRSFNKLYTINAPPVIPVTLGFRKSGAPIMEVENDDEDSWFSAPGALAIYEPESKSVTYTGIDGLHNSFFVHSYVETLLLLGN